MSLVWRYLRLPLKSRPLLLIDLPEPLVNLILLQVELFRELNTLFSRWNAPLLLLEDLVEHVHLIRVFPLAITGVVCTANHLLEKLLIGDSRQVVM